MVVRRVMPRIVHFNLTVVFLSCMADTDPNAWLRNSIEQEYHQMVDISDDP